MSKILVLEENKLDSKLEEVFFRCLKIAIQNHLPKSIQSNYIDNKKENPVKYGNAKDAAKRYGVHYNTVKNWAKQGFIKKRIVEGVSLYSFEEIDTFIDSKAV